MKVKAKFNVLLFDFSGKTMKKYDVLPYFRNSWKDKYNKEGKEKVKTAKHESKRKQLFKEWIRSESSYMFHARCEYEFLMASWPFGSKNITEKLKVFLSKNYNLDDYCDKIDFYNIIISEMDKIDVHEQILMNIDVIADLLYSEFFKKL